MSYQHGKVAIICNYCGSSKEVYHSWSKRKFCSDKCHRDSTKGKEIEWFKSYIQKGQQNNTGRTHFKKGQNIENNNIKWTGDNVGYTALHDWVKRNLGFASYCEEEDLTCKGRFEWANISNLYLRELSDWKQLCRSHHIRFDKNKGTWGKANNIFEQKGSHLTKRRITL